MKKRFSKPIPAEVVAIVPVLALLARSGVDGSSGPSVFLSSVPYPRSANGAFTPHAMPWSRSQLGGGLFVNLTNIRRLADGRIAFHIGYEYQ
jgi:hypothetical protein